MSEEEKKAIEELEDFIEDDEIQNISVFTAKKIKNIIDKQQNEIEDMREELQMYVDIGNNNLHNYISKAKIREIFQFYIEQDSLFNDDTHKMAVIRLKDVLQELLEEN